ncbi:MAG: type II toxin-antitoxin system VapC family toxin [Bryobacteraceae bacterium]
MIVLDTNVLSEALRPSPSVVVLRWLAAQEPMDVFMTTITQAEVLYGVEVLPAGRRRTRLYNAIEKLFSDEFQGRILSFDEESARVFAKIVSGREAMGRPISQFDAMIAAISRSRRAAVATRNISDYQDCGVRIINPWDG